MLAEAVDVMRQLWTGETVDHWGEYYTVENARLFTRPAEPIPVIWAASGPESAVAAAEHGDGLWSTSPDPEVVRAYRDAGGDGPDLRAGDAVLGDRPRRGREDRARGVAERREPGPVVAGPADLDALRARRRARHRGDHRRPRPVRPGRVTGRRAGPRRTRMPASTTSTSTRSALTNAGSPTSGAPSSSTPWS